MKSTVVAVRRGIILFYRSPFLVIVIIHLLLKIIMVEATPEILAMISQPITLNFNIVNYPGPQIVINHPTRDVLVKIPYFILSCLGIRNKTAYSELMAKRT